MAIMNWKQLLWQERPAEYWKKNSEHSDHKSNSKIKGDERKYFDSFPAGIRAFIQDYTSITNSSYFRRMQDKTQVYTLGDNDFVRTRLTHSMEVASVAEQLKTL